MFLVNAIAIIVINWPGRAGTSYFVVLPHSDGYSAYQGACCMLGRLLDPITIMSAPIHDADVIYVSSGDEEVVPSRTSTSQGAQGSRAATSAPTITVSIRDSRRERELRQECRNLEQVCTPHSA
jgi:hypothetical protein